MDIEASSSGTVPSLSLAGALNSSGSSSVPIPAAIWLFGTGLIGLIGTRRRFTK
jgi:hypothetical protein